MMGFRAFKTALIGGVFLFAAHASPVLADQPPEEDASLAGDGTRFSDPDRLIETVMLEDQAE
ncbi:MAG: hypothetical protein VCD66_01760, partial [Alphaproteobacteria bacterium]